MTVDDNYIVKRAQEPGRQSRLAHAGRPQNREQLTGTFGDDALPDARQLALLTLAPHHRRIRMPGKARPTPNREQPVSRDRLGLTFEGPMLSRRDLDSVSRQPERLLADENLAGLSRLLQSSSDVDGVAGRKPLLGTGHNLARGHTDAALDS
jgi:hypothetical protein